MGNLKKYFLFLAIILVVPLPSLFWLPPGEILGHGPVYPWPNASVLWELATKHLFAWISIGGFGNLNSDPSGFLFHAYSSLAVIVSGSSYAGQVLFLFFGFVGCIGGMFILARTLGFTSIASLIAGVFYLLSPMVMSGMPIEIVNLRVLPYYIATPVLLSIVVRIINPSSARRELALFGIVSILLGSVGYSSLQYFVLHLILICTYIVFVITVALDRQERIKIVRRSFVIFTIMFLANFYWLSPILFDLSGAYARRVEPEFSDVNLLRGLSVKLIDGFRMLPYPEQANISPWIAYYYTLLMTLITFGFVAIAGFAFLSPKTKRAAIFPGLLLVITLFFGKGVREPLSAVGKVMFLFFPYVTRLFRNPTYFATLVVFALALLIGLAIGEIIRIASTKSWRYLIITAVAVTILVVMYGWQFLIGGPISSQPKDSPSQTVEVPLYYTELAQFLRDDYRTFRITSLPTFTRQDVFVAYRWQNLFVGVPSLSMSSGKSILRPLYPGSKGVNPLFDSAMHPQSDIISQDTWRALLQTANVRYVTFHNDTDWKYLIKQGLRFSREETHEFVEKSPYLRWISNFGAIELYEFNSDLFLPYFYIPQNIIYSPNDIEALPEIVGFDDYEIRSGIFLADNADEKDTDSADKKLITLRQSSGQAQRADEVFVVGKRVEPVLRTLEPVLESLEPEWSEGWAWPEANVKPGSWKYPLVQLKERWVEWGAREPLERVDVLLWHGVKRIEEIGKWGAGETTDIKYWILDVGILGYKEKIGKVVEILESVPKEERGEEFWGMVGKALAYMGRTEEKIGDIEELHSGFREWVEGIADIWGEGEYRYEIKIPKDGEYEIYVNKAGWVSFGKRHFAKGKYVLKFEVPLVEGVVLFESLPSVAEPREIPKITFVKVNPTKYRVKVEGAKDPYTLIFSESFHGGWRIYEVQSSKFKVQNDYGDVVASYFDGDIKEGTHRNTFLEPATFETWGKRPLDVEHLEVNGYANSWYIKPEDMGGEEDYELIIEFFPQRLFYIGLLISSLTFLGCVGCLGYAGVKRLE